MMISRRTGSKLNVLFCTACLLVVLLVNTKATAQRTDDITYKQIAPPAEWSEGSIMLADGTELRGRVRYNDKNGLVAYESDGASRSYTSRNVVALEFFDAAQNKQRIYYAIELKDPDTDLMRPAFVEVLRDFKTFAVVARMDPVELEDRSSSQSRPLAPGAPNSPSLAGGSVNGVPVIIPIPAKTVFTQVETIYFLNSDLMVEPFVKITHTVKDGVFRDVDKEKGKVLDKDVMSKYFMEPGYSRLLQYIEVNELDLRRRDDLIKVLDFYASVN